MFKYLNSYVAAENHFNTNMSKSTSSMMKLEDRDPNSLSENFQVLWDDVIGEPEGNRSPECVWRLSQQCFKHSRNCCYTFLTVLFAPFIAVCLGFGFACLAFEHIWCITPCLRGWKISFSALRTFCVSCTYATVIPCTEAFGQFWSNIKVRVQTLPEVPIRKEDPLIV